MASSTGPYAHTVLPEKKKLANSMAFRIDGSFIASKQHRAMSALGKKRKQRGKKRLIAGCDFARINPASYSAFSRARASRCCASLLTRSSDIVNASIIRGMAALPIHLLELLDDGSALCGQDAHPSNGPLDAVDLKVVNRRQLGLGLDGVVPPSS